MYTALTFKGEKHGLGKDSVAGCMIKKGNVAFLGVSRSHYVGGA